MPKFHEVYGDDVYSQSLDAVERRKGAICPFILSQCDGGGNRHQTKIKLKNSRIEGFFNPGIDAVIPGVCSIEYGNEAWIVCPRRLLGFPQSKDNNHTINEFLNNHERESLIAAGLPTGTELGVWAEVYLQHGDDDVSINYHFDFVVAEIAREAMLSDVLHGYGIVSEEDKEEAVKSAITGGYLRGKRSVDTPVPVLPNLRSPVIIEVMTASTSGSDSEAGTDIAASFSDAILGNEHHCPGINKRQVWGRMATQLFAKSALAESWGGKTVWLVQDQLLNNIELTTRLDLERVPEAISGTINFLCMSYKEGCKGPNSLVLHSYRSRHSGMNLEGSNACTDILLPKVNPGKKELMKSVLRRKLSAIIVL